MPQMFPMNWFIFSLVPLLLYMSPMLYNVNFIGNSGSTTVIFLKNYMWSW